MISILTALLLVSMVAATDTTLTDDSITMGYEDERTVQFCMYHKGQPVDIEIIINPVCKELDNVLGCSDGDLINPSGFSVTTNDLTTGSDGCANITIMTSLSEEEAGIFAYTVNGYNGLSVVGAETGSVSVPEFGVLAAFGVLGLAGLFVFNKRKD